MATQLDDSAKIQIKDKWLILHYIINPPVFDTTYADISARNMEASLVHLGYYNAKVKYNKPDTVTKGDQKRVSIKYNVNTGPPTLIDTMSYQFKKSELQDLVNSNMKNSFLIENKPVTKADISAENSRLVDLFRNNGYYKFSSDDLQMIGDTTIASLTTISDDPFENLRLLAEAQEKRSTPTIKLAMILNPLADTAHFRKYFIDSVYIYPDYYSSESSRRRKFYDDTSNNYIIRYRRKLFNNSFLTNRMAFKKGDVYRQDDYIKTINNFSKIGVWQSVSILTRDTLDKLNMSVHLLPARKFGFEANIETSYSSNNNYSQGNLLGFSGNLSLQNRNLKNKEGIKMTHGLHAGVEFNISKNKSTTGLINSNDVGYTNTVSIPRLVWPFTSKDTTFRHFFKPANKTSQQSFSSVGVSYTNRIDLFNLQSFSLGVGYSWVGPKNGSWVVKPLNAEFSRLYNESKAFRDTLERYPYLKYSFNTALVMGSSINYIYNFPGKQNVIKVNFEESGYPMFFVFPAVQLGLFKNYLRQFIKADFDYTNNETHPKGATVFHAFLGIGVPLGTKDKTLPFFKQYFSGGANSMRGWPLRGIGPGKVPIKPYGTNSFNDRTGDLKIEVNYEYRHRLLQIIPNSIVLDYALFADVGNIWNLRSTKLDGSIDSAQFKFQNLWRELGVAAGAGFRIDFSYFLIRFDFGLRFKRPDISENNGWQIPNVTFNNIFKRGEVVPDPNNQGKTYNDDRYKKWRYENFNFTVGISYPF
ncbi:MAG: BamA/TamA family outer membrane protein [Bacteroidota bacterium]